MNGAGHAGIWPVSFGDGLGTALDKIKAILPNRTLGYFADIGEAGSRHGPSRPVLLVVFPR